MDGVAVDQSGHDFRAIAEGARVQFYWHLAGLGHSVSAHYMDRQRNELDWIRAAIRATAIPYEDARVHFLALPRTLQIRALQCVPHGWHEVTRELLKTNSAWKRRNCGLGAAVDANSAEH